MSRYLVDTNAISELMTPDPDFAVQLWFRLADVDSLFASVMNLGEIHRGIENLRAGRRRRDLKEWVGTGFPAWFGSHLLPVTGKIAERWGRLTTQAQRKEITLATADGLIAATAIEHGLTLVTRNVEDFSGLDLSVLDPWRKQSDRT